MNKTPPAADLDELATFVDQATPTPWWLSAHDGAVMSRVDDGISASNVFIGEWDFKDTDIALVLAAVNALPDLIAELKRLRARVSAADLLIAALEVPCKTCGKTFTPHWLKTRNCLSKVCPVCVLDRIKNFPDKEPGQ